jgi:hypothetical protein
MTTVISRADVVGLLAGYGDRPPSAVGPDLDSLELAWLVHQVEQRFGAPLDLDDDELAAMSTVDGAVTALNGAIGARR